MAQSETTTDHPPTSAATSVTMTHPQIMKALSGLMLGMFVAILSSTIVSNALPRSSATSAAPSPRTRGWSPPPCCR